MRNAMTRFADHAVHPACIMIETPRYYLAWIMVARPPHSQFVVRGEVTRSVNALFQFSNKISTAAKRSATETWSSYKAIVLSPLLERLIQYSNTIQIHTFALTPSHTTTLSINSTQQPTTINMQITDLLLLSLAAFVAADCDENSNDGDDCTSSSAGTATITRTSTDVNGVVLTSFETSTSVLVESSFVPLSTLVSDSSTSLAVDTDRSTIRETTDIGSTATNTEFATTTDVGLAGGYAYTTNSEGSTIATYTGTDDSQPRTSSITTSTAVAAASGDEESSTASESSDSFAAATAVPYIGAAAMAGLAFIV